MKFACPNPIGRAMRDGSNCRRLLFGPSRSLRKDTAMDQDESTPRLMSFARLCKKWERYIIPPREACDGGGYIGIATEEGFDTVNALLANYDAYCECFCLADDVLFMHVAPYAVRLTNWEDIRDLMLEALRHCGDYGVRRVEMFVDACPEPFWKFLVATDKKPSVELFWLQRFDPQPHHQMVRGGRKAPDSLAVLRRSKPRLTIVGDDKKA